MARTPKDVEQIVNLLRDFMFIHPQLRLGQILVNALGRDPFYMSDQEAIMHLQQRIKDIKTVQPYIPKSMYKTCYVDNEPYFTYVDDALLRHIHTPDEVQSFYEFMRGQTCGVVNDQAAYYTSDYERWVEQGMPKQQGPDWD